MMIGCTPSASGPLARKLLAQAARDAAERRRAEAEAAEAEARRETAARSMDRVAKIARVSRIESCRARMRAAAMLALAERTAELERRIAEIEETKPLLCSNIQRLVADYYGVTVLDIVSARRSKEIILPRQVAMYLARATTTRSLPEIGRRFGGRDHTTVIHAVRKIEALVAEGGQVAADVAALKGKLAAGRLG